MSLAAWTQSSLAATLGIGAKAPRAMVRLGVNEARGWSKFIDGALTPRLTFLARPPFANLVALMCIGAALITFPRGLIPLAPGLAVVFFGLGMTAHDCLWLLGGAGWARLIF